MRVSTVRLPLRLFIVAGLMLVVAGLMAWGNNSPVRADSPAQADADQIAQGRYIAVIAGCITCHTPYQDQYLAAELTEENLRTVSLFEVSALDETRLLGGGRVFSLGPQGAVVAPNLTPDEETGIGSWTDEELEITLRTGMTPDGRQLFPVMPFRLYNQMADSDMEALIAYLRSVEPVSNETPPFGMEVPPFNLPMPEEPIVAPAPEDTENRGQYLFRAILPCTDCHTPLDASTGQPQLDKLLAGGQPFEGPWGIAYSANVTPHEATGIGSWSDTEVIRAITAGVRKDGRRVILMNWQDYTNLTPADIQAVLHFLRNIPAVENEVPAPAINPAVEERVDVGTDAAAEDDEEDSDSGTLLYVVVGLIVVAVAGGGLGLMLRRRSATAK